MIGEVLTVVLIAIIVSFITVLSVAVPIIGIIDGDFEFVKFVYVTIFIRLPISLYDKVQGKLRSDDIDDLIEEKYTERQIKNTKIGMEDDLISKEEKSLT